MSTTSVRGETRLIKAKKICPVRANVPWTGVEELALLYGNHPAHPAGNNESDSSSSGKCLHVFLARPQRRQKLVAAKAVATREWWCGGAGSGIDHKMSYVER